MEDISNKEFVKQYIPFGVLKKAGFFPKSIKRTDYDAIVNRFLSFMGKTKRQYILNQPSFRLQTHPNVLEGTMTPTVNEKGELIQNSFHLSLEPSTKKP